MLCPRCTTRCTEPELTPDTVNYARSKPFDVCNTCGRFGGQLCDSGPCDYRRVWGRREANTPVCPACLAEIQGKPYTQVSARMTNAWLRAAERMKGE